MKVTILTTNKEHPVNSHLIAWMKSGKTSATVELVHNKSDLSHGDLLFLVSCSEIIPREIREKYRACLVLHASDLPKGRGWSPHIWEIRSGADSITLSLLEAEGKVDSGRIWKKILIPIPKHALYDEINELLFKGEIELIEYAIKNQNIVGPEPQPEAVEATYYPRRTPNDSRLNPESKLVDLFNEIRVCDPNRYPAFFEHLGYRYIIKMEKISDKHN